MRFSAALAALLLAGCTAGAGNPGYLLPPSDLHLEFFGERNARTLIVVIHADEGPAARADERSFAEAAARGIPGSAAVTILRPGFDDARGNRSPGMRGAGFGDDYGQVQIDRLAHAVSDARNHYVRPRVILIGDAGGAALAANIAATRPGLADGLVLVGCPCSLPEWRSHMAARSSDAGWKRPVTSFDPLQTAGGLDPAMRAAVLVGADDQITPVKLSRSYAEALSLRGIATDYRIVPGKGHDLLLDPEVLAATRRLAAALPRKS